MDSLITILAVMRLSSIYFVAFSMLIRSDIEELTKTGFEESLFHNRLLSQLEVGFHS